MRAVSTRTNSENEQQAKGYDYARLYSSGIVRVSGRPTFGTGRGKDQTLDVGTKKERESTQRGLAANRSEDPL